MSSVTLQTDIAATDAYVYAQQHGVEQWFDAYVIRPRTRQNRISAGQPLKQREADRFQRLQLLIERASEAFDHEAKGVFWLTRQSYVYDGKTPLECAAWEMGFLVVLEHLHRIEYGVYA